MVEYGYWLSNGTRIIMSKPDYFEEKLQLGMMVVVVLLLVVCEPCYMYECCLRDLGWRRRITATRVLVVRVRLSLFDIWINWTEFVIINSTFSILDLCSWFFFSGFVAPNTQANISTIPLVWVIVPWLGVRRMRAVIHRVQGSNGFHGKRV